MYAARYVYDERRAEIREYVDFLHDLEENDTQLALRKRGQARYRHKEVQTTVRSTLRANAILLLYNLAEAVMRLAIKDIYDEIERTGVAFEELRETLRGQIIGQFKKNGPANFHTGTHPISRAIIRAGFLERKTFEGNIKHRDVLMTANAYGFRPPSGRNVAQQATSLAWVTERRQHLAHGDMAFTAVGNGASMQEIDRIADEVIAYLDNALKNVEKYLDGREYLHDPAAA